MDRAAVGRVIAGGAVVVGLGTLLFAPGLGGIALSPVVQSFVDRFEIRYPEAERVKLATLECLEAQLAVIPDGSDVWIHTDQNEYYSQRLTEMAFPRLTPVTSGAQYGVYVDLAPGSGESIASTTCGNANIEIVRYG